MINNPQAIVHLGTLGWGIPIIFLLFIIIFSGFITAGIFRNDLPMTSPPGFMKRLRTYLSTNIAETSEDSPFPELVTPVLQIPMKDAIQKITEGITKLNWEIVNPPNEEGAIHAVVTTRLWRFKDDVWIRLEPVGDTQTRINIRSCSRVGKGDLGTNTRHILDLLEVLRDDRIDQRIP